jgi:hypothetical protein
MKPDTIERYIRIAQGVNQHHEGLIDAYFGNPAWKEPWSINLEELKSELERLSDDLEQVEDAGRQQFLTVQTRAMQTIVNLKLGVPISFIDETRGIYDIEPIRKDESLFLEAHQNLERLLPGSGSITERWRASRQKFKIAPEKLRAVTDIINLEFQSRSRKLFGITAVESCEFALVQNKPWSGYNWYLGDGRSRIDINTDLPKYLHDLPDLVAHEGYPGHHTEHIVKEQKLLFENDWQEFSIQLLNSPESVLAEGIATSALGVVMPESELAVWIAQDLAEAAGLQLTLEEVQSAFQIAQARKSLGYVDGNAALMLFQDGASEATILEYLQQYNLGTLEEVQKRLEFIKHNRAYVYTYSTGYDAIQPLLERHDKITTFNRLLEQPVTPSQLQNWNSR